jgi:hypothetical protein
MPEGRRRDEGTMRHREIKGNIEHGITNLEYRK